MYDLKTLGVFASVIRHGNLTASARECDLPKSTVSRRLQQLEAQAGQPLLRRDGKRMLPTEAGLVLESYCRQILALAEESQEALGELQQQVSGQLSLHIHDALIRGWFAQQMDRFLALYPNVRTSLHTLSSVPDAGETDLLGLWLGSLPAELGLREETLGRLTRGIYAHPDYLARWGIPAHPRDLSHHRWVDLLGDSNDGLTLQHGRHGSFPLVLPSSRMQVDRMVLQGDAIAKGQGLGLMPHWLAEQRLHHHPGTLAPCLPDWHAPPLPVRLLYPRGQLSRRARTFIEFIRQNVPAAWQGYDQDSPRVEAQGSKPELAPTRD